MLLKVLVLTILSVGYVHSQQATEGDLRLAGTGSTTSQGRLEIYHDGSWGTVCDDAFATEDASVVCRQLGFPAVGAEHRTTNVFGAGTGTIWLDQLGCSGNELRLEVCTHSGWNITDCGHSEDVGVFCVADPNAPVTTQQPVTDPPIIVEPGNCTAENSLVRLKGPASAPGTGVVQVRKDGVWGGVCDNAWDIKDARVVCRMLCYDANKALAGSVNFDTSDINEAMTINRMNCVGTESSIVKCPQSDWAENSCERSEMARVTCEDLNNAPPSRPEPLVECDNGMITASFSLTRDPFLETKHLSVYLTYSGGCEVVKTTIEGYVTIAVPFDVSQCGTQVTMNDTHITYKTVIEYLPTSSQGNIGRANTYIVHVQCEIPRNVGATDKPIVPLTETVTQSAQGTFGVTLNFYSNNGFENAVTEFPLKVPLGQYLNIGLYLEQVDPDLRLVVPSCYATPSSDKNDAVKYTLFTNKCQTDATVGFFPVNETAWGFRFQTFKFVQFSEVYIHCDAIVCRTEETSPECDRSCLATTTTSTTTATTTTQATNVPGGAGRRRRRSVTRDVIHVSSRAVSVYDPTVDNPSEIIRVPLEQTSPRPAENTSPKTTSKSNLPSPKATSESHSHTTVDGNIVFAKTETTTTPRHTLPNIIPAVSEPPSYSREDVVVLETGSGTGSISQLWFFVTLAISLVALLLV